MLLRIARNSARRSRTQALNQKRSIISTAPEPIRCELRHLNVYRMLEKASAYRPRNRAEVVGGTRFVLRTLAKRAIALEAEVKEIDQILKDLVADTAPDLVARSGLSTDTTSTLLVAAGDNPSRLRNEASFAHLCGVAPIDASSGKTNATSSTAAATAKPTPPCGRSPSAAWRLTKPPATTSNAEWAKASPRKKPSAASNATSHARSTTTSQDPNPPLDNPQEHRWVWVFPERPSGTLSMRRVGSGWEPAVGTFGTC